MGSERGTLESLRRAGRTVFFMVILLGSLIISSAPMLVAVADVGLSCTLLSTFTCCTSCFSFKIDWTTYSFRTSLVDIPLLSLVRSFIIICAYAVCGIPRFCYGAYLATTVVSGLASVVILVIKGCIFGVLTTEPVDIFGPSPRHLKHMWGVPLLFLSSMVFALGHFVVAYKASCQARRKLLFYRADEEAVFVCKVSANGYQKHSKSLPSAYFWKSNNRNGSSKHSKRKDNVVPACILADEDSLFMQCKGIMLHYKVYVANDAQRQVLVAASHGHANQLSKLEKLPSSSASLDSIYTPLLNKSFSDTGAPSFNGWPGIYNHVVGSKFESILEIDLPFQKPGRVEQVSGMRNNSDFSCEGVVLVHGFGGGVFSWRHVMNPLATESGLNVVAFDRPGWGLTSRPNRQEWEMKGLPNPYDLHSQVDLLLAFCHKLGLSSVVFVGHDDGGLLAVMAAAKISELRSTSQLEVKGVVLVAASLTREVVPTFARVLLHTSLGRHVLRPLLRSEIGQAANRRAWHDVSKLTSEILDIYKAPFHVEGWDQALAEASKSSVDGVLKMATATELLQMISHIPALLIAGMQDMLVPLKAVESLALRLPKSKLVAIPRCGHLPPEECPGALLDSMVPFISELLGR